MRFPTSRQFLTIFDFFAVLNSVTFYLYDDITLTKLIYDAIKNNDVCDQMKKDINDIDIKIYGQAKCRRHQSVCRITRSYFFTRTIV